MATFGGANIVTDNLVLWLDAANRSSYPGSGTTWRDMSGNNNNGTLTNGPTFSSANNGSIVFDGVDDYINIPNNASVNPVSEITINLWLNPTSLETKTTSAIVCRNIITGTAGYDIYINSSGSINFFIRTSNNSSFFITSSLNSIQNSNWYNITATYTSANTRIYINSSLNSISTSQTGNINQPTIDDLRIGMDWNTARCFTGRIPTTQIYNRALSPSEVQQNYDALKSRYLNQY